MASWGTTTGWVSILYSSSTPWISCIRSSSLRAATLSTSAVRTAACGVGPVPVMLTTGAVKPNSTLGATV